MQEINTGIFLNDLPEQSGCRNNHYHKLCRRPKRPVQAICKGPEVKTQNRLNVHTSNILDTNSTQIRNPNRQTVTT